MTRRTARVVRILAAMALATSLFSSVASAANILVNPGFETGDLFPWFNSNNFCGCLWDVTDVDFHSGVFSAQVDGNRLLEQDVAPIATSNINEVSVWLRMPDTGVSTFYFLYSDATFEEIPLFFGDGAWTFFDVTSFLATGKFLAGIGVYGCSDCDGLSVTRADDWVLDIGAIPEPASVVLFATGLISGIIRARRKAQA
jgi:hypothetical protein